jgi:hypothetical protein
LKFVLAALIDRFGCAVASSSPSGLLVASPSPRLPLVRLFQESEIMKILLAALLAASAMAVTAPAASAQPYGWHHHYWHHHYWHRHCGWRFHHRWCR